MWYNCANLCEEDYIKHGFPVPDTFYRGKTSYKTEKKKYFVDNFDIRLVVLGKEYKFSSKLQNLFTIKELFDYVQSYIETNNLKNNND